MTVTSNIVLGVAAWQSSHAYSLGDLVTTSFPRAYQCVHAGTSASSGGPTGTSSLIVDSGASWAYLCDVTYTTLQSWANAIPSTLTQPYIGQILSAGLINMDASLSTLTPYLNLTGHTTSPTNTITLIPFPGFGFRDKLAVPGTALAINTSAVGFITTLRGAQYDVGAIVINDANVILDGLQFRKIAPTGPEVYPGGGSFILNGHTYSIRNDTFALRDGSTIAGDGGGDAALAADADTVYAEDGSTGEWYRWDGASTWTGPAYLLILLRISTAPNIVVRNCIIDSYSDSFGGSVIDFSCQANFYNNLIFDREGPAGVYSAIHAWNATDTAGSNFVNNNFIRTYKNASSIFVNLTTPSNSGAYTLRNNIGTGSGTVFYCGATANADHNATDYTNPYGGSVVNGGNNLTSITPSAQFVNTTSDFRLKAGASVINAGTSDTTHVPSATDIVGNPRVGTTWDMGVAEFTVSASAITKSLQFSSASSATQTSPTVSASATAAVVFTAVVSLGRRTLVSAATPALSFTVNGQFGSQTLVTATSAFNIGVLFANIRLNVFASATAALTATAAITAKQSDGWTISQPVLIFKTSSVATFNLWSAYGGGTIVTAGGALATFPTLANAASSLVYSCASTVTLFTPFQTTALVNVLSFTAQGVAQTRQAIGLASIPTLTSSVNVTFGSFVLFLTGGGSLRYSSTASLSSFTNAAVSTSLVVSASVQSGGSNPTTTLVTPSLVAATGVAGQRLLIPATVISLPTLTLAGAIGSSCFGISRFSLAATIHAGGELRTAGIFQLTFHTPQPVSLLLQADATVPKQLLADGHPPVPLRADIIGPPTVILKTSTAVAVTWPTITSAVTAINSLGAHAAVAALTFNAIAAGQQFDPITAAISLSFTATVTAVQRSPTTGSVVYPTLTAVGAAELHDTASITAAITYVASGQLNQFNPVSGTDTVLLTVSAQAAVSQLASAAIVWPSLGLGTGGGTAILGSAAVAALPVLTWAAAGSAGQNCLINAAASLPGLTPAVSVVQEALASAAVTSLQFTSVVHMLQFWEAAAVIDWPPVTAHSVPSLFASGTAPTLGITAVANCLNTTNYTSGLATLSFMTGSAAFNPPTVFTAGASPLGHFAFAAATASINAGQFSATLSIQFNALGHGAQYVAAAAASSWTINVATGIAQARLWATPPGFVEGSDTVWWSS